MSRGKKARLDALRRAAALLDAVTLDRVFECALRGDLTTVYHELGPYLNGNNSETKTVGWRQSSSWLFDREAYDRPDESS